MTKDTQARDELLNELDFFKTTHTVVDNKKSAKKDKQEKKPVKDLVDLGKFAHKRQRVSKTSGADLYLFRHGNALQG